MEVEEEGSFLLSGSLPASASVFSSFLFFLLLQAPLLHRPTPKNSLQFFGSAFRLSRVSWSM